MSPPSNTNGSSNPPADGHPALIELELCRSGEGEAAVQAHLEGCALCQAALASLESFAAGVEAATTEHARVLPAIPSAVDRAIETAAQAALARAVANAEEDSKTAGGATVLRPARFSGWAKALGGASAVAASLLLMVGFFGDNVRAMFGASADALAGNESRSVRQGVSHEAHKSLKNFSSTSAPEATLTQRAPPTTAAVPLQPSAPARALRRYNLVLERPRLSTNELGLLGIRFFVPLDAGPPILLHGDRLGALEGYFQAGVTLGASGETLRTYRIDIPVGMNRQVPSVYRAPDPSSGGPVKASLPFDFEAGRDLRLRDAVMIRGEEIIPLKARLLERD